MMKYFFKHPLTALTFVFFPIVAFAWIGIEVGELIILQWVMKNMDLLHGLYLQ